MQTPNFVYSYIQWLSCISTLIPTYSPRKATVTRRKPPSSCVFRCKEDVDWAGLESSQVLLRSPLKLF